MITTPITNIAETDISQLFHLKKLHLKGPPLAYPILATENFEILLLAAASFYWDLVHWETEEIALLPCVQNRVTCVSTNTVTKSPNTIVNSMHR